MRARKALVAIEDPELGTIRMPGVLPKLSDTPGKVRYAGLPMRVHNEEIYRDRLGLSDRELKVLAAEGFI
jgi:crotonobetainyl-CoA:carnitine CoA-transferase CaiB-like acyl-CoA transferase